MSFNVREVAEFIINWLDDYSAKSGIDSFVVGVSGGIDSAVTASLCARTGRATFILNMPIHQHPSEVDRSDELISNLVSEYSNVTALEVSLTEVYEAFKSSLPDTQDKSCGLAMANTRARLRMTTLYALAAERGALVVGTGNKIEDFGIGFYTKYGDGGVDISPIADLVKTEVYQVGSALGVPKSIMDAAPTDGLWGDNRNDEDQIGATYSELEKAMNQAEEFQNGKGSPDDLEGREAEVFAIYTKLNRANQHKMLPIPVCVIPR
ncbi:MAG: NAD(+) synthase [Crocinitomicaceae bacterium]|nr:NAD(+) synthase [Crocinitomicaceae bacterium]